MSEERHPSPAEFNYLGEPKPRKPWLAFWGSLIFPGWSQLYFGQVLGCTVISLAYVSTLGLFVIMWTQLKFFPALPGAVMLLLGLSIAAGLGRNASRYARALGGRYVLKGTNHIVVYVTVLMVVFVLPVSGLIHFTQSRLWNLITMASDQMYPTLVMGDTLIVDRTAYRGRRPILGEIILIRAPHEGEPPLIGRVVAEPGDLVEVRSGLVWVDGQALIQIPISSGDSALGAMLGALDDITAPEGLVAFAEQAGEAQYLISARNAEGDTAHHVVLREDEYYVLHDNRSFFGDSRTYGPVHMSRVIGQPLYVTYSRDATGFHWNRFAKRVQPQPLRRN